MSNRFKSALFSGFNRRDVVSYITDQAKQKEALAGQTAELEARLDEMRQALAEAQAENQALQAELAEAIQRADSAEETCRSLQQAVRSSLTELNALSGIFECEEEAAPEESDVPEEPAFPGDDTPADPEPVEPEISAEEEDVCEAPGDDTPADGLPEEPAVLPADEPPAKKRTVKIRRHERI